MATEEFKALTKELFENYVELHDYMKKKVEKDISLSFKEYLDFYLTYQNITYNNLEDYDDDSEDYDYDDEEEEDYDLEDDSK